MTPLKKIFLSAHKKKTEINKKTISRKSPAKLALINSIIVLEKKSLIHLLGNVVSNSQEENVNV
jgi:hypothetical protein